MDDALSAAYDHASTFLVETVRTIPEGSWEAPGLGVWSVRELVGHANRGHTTVEDYLLHPQPPEPPGSVYFSEEAIAARGRQAVAALGDDPVGAVARASARVRMLVAQREPRAVLGTPFGSVTLIEYLPTRISELVIHALDIGTALDIPLTAPSTALAVALSSVAARAATRSGEAVLLALSGRGPLPEGYSVY